MNAPETKLFLLQHWRSACLVAGPAVLPLFGLTPADMAALIAADQPTLRYWASLPLTLVTPRPGLLATLHARNRPRVLGHIARLPQPA